MRKYLAILILTISSLSFASIDQEQLQKALVGLYQLDLKGEGSLNFAYRSSGEIKIIRGEVAWGDENPEVDVSFLGSSSAWIHSGLPVAVLTITTGSDEDTTDYHIQISADQDWTPQNNVTITLIGGFKTFNDGPNDVASVEKLAVSLKKYNKKTKKYIKVNSL